MTHIRYQDRLIVMGKYPACGLVKTRLAREIGNVEAAVIYRRMLSNILRVVNSFPHWQTYLALPPEHLNTFQSEYKNFEMISQGIGSLGQKMQSLFNNYLPGKMLIVGSDIPGIAHEDICSGFEALNASDFVIGPGYDGGYWLIGARRIPKVIDGIFNDVRWSSANTLEDTLANLSNYKVSFLRRLNDIDNKQDLDDIY